MWHQLSLRQQILLGFVAVISIFVIALGALGIQLRQIQADVRQIDGETLPFLLLVEDMNLARSETQDALTDVAATREPDGFKEAEESAQRFFKGSARFKAMFLAEGDAQNVAKIEALDTEFAAFYALGKKMAATYMEKGHEAGNHEMERFDTEADKLGKMLNAFREHQEQEAKDLTVKTLSHATRMGWMMVVALAVATVLAIVVGGAVALSVLRVLGGEPREAAQLAQEVGAGNLTTKLQVKHGDADSLMAQLLVMQDNLARVVSRIRQTSDSVATAATQIATGNHDLSQRTSGQASALEQAASAMEQMGSAVETNAQNGLEATALARSASDVAERGGAVVTEVVTTMAGINEASRKIADIIGVIDGIAFQTNILALNAAVEAARAGEQGRGFAVVASEVRALAQRSAQAAREIKDLIQSSVHQVEAGSVLVNQAGSTMAEVVGSVKKVAELIGEISTASHEQAQGVSQMGQTVAHLDHDVQQNAALVEEMDSAANALNEQAHKLVHIVSVFKTS